MSKQAKTLLSKSVYNRLTKTLLSIEKARTASEINHAYDTLRNQLANLFSLRTVGQYPNQVMVDFAEVLQGLYDEKDDLSSYLFHIQQYLYKQITRYEETTDQLSRQAQLARKRVTITPIEKLDIDYQTWVYSHGYYKQQYEMYQHLLSIAQQILLYDKARVKK